MKKIIVIMLIHIVLCIFSGCSSDSSGSDEEMRFEQLEWPTYENAKQIPVPESTMADVRSSNNVIFEFYLANTTLEDYKSYVEKCKAMGFTVEPVEQEYRYYAFNEAKYELTVQHQEGDIMYVCIVEDQFDVEIKLLHADKASADMYSLEIEIDDIYEDSSEQGDEAITFYSKLKEGKHTLTVENSDDDNINGRIVFEVSEDEEYFEFEINCLSNKVEISQVGGNDTKMNTEDYDNLDDINSYDEINSYTNDCDASGCYNVGTEPYIGISGEIEYYCSTHYDELLGLINDMEQDVYGDYDYSYDNDYGDGYGYDSDDPFYSANDQNNDGLLTDEEWLDAMEDALNYYDSLFE